MNHQHFPCPGGCGELADECMTPGCGSPFGAFIYDPIDAELAVAWNRPDAPEAHRAAWALHQELRQP